MRSFVVAGFVWGACLAGTAAAQEQSAAPEVLDRVYACRALTGESERLACYDAAVGALHSAQQTGDIVAVDRQQAQELREEAFGFQMPNLAAIIPNLTGGNEPSIDLVVERVVERANGYHAFVMTNGQVWTQVVPESASNVRPGATITVGRASLGSYMLRTGRGRAHRVRRES